MATVLIQVVLAFGGQSKVISKLMELPSVPRIGETVFIGDVFTLVGMRLGVRDVTWNVTAPNPHAVVLVGRACEADGEMEEWIRQLGQAGWMS